MNSAYLTALVAVAAFVAAAPYMVYPAVVWWLARRRQAIDPPGAPPLSEVGQLPRLSILIPAYNEQSNIESKIRNALAQDYPADRLEIIVGSDGSTDGTADIVRDFAADDVRLVELAERQGKPTILKEMLAVATGDLVMFTDASAQLAPSTARRLAQACLESGVGFACARYVVRGDGRTTGESGYWSWSAQLKAQEAASGMMIGAHGACYMAWRHAVPSIDSDLVNDDFVIPLLIRAEGLRGSYLHDVVVEEDPTGAWRSIFYRLMRIARGNWQMFSRYRELFLPRHGMVALALWGKLLKTCSPLAAGALGLLLTFGAERDTWASNLAFLGWSAFVVAALGVFPRLRISRVQKILAYGFMAIIAYTAGTVEYLLGRGTIRWNRPESDELVAAEHVIVQPPFSVRLVKRSLDVLGALIFLIVLGPVMLLVALAIRLDSPGSVIYHQRRLGFDEHGRLREFSILKFRSMCQDAEKLSGPVWAQDNDPRITRVGAFIRKTRLDELPQLFNVLSGHMSMVGPRPERLHFADQLETVIPGYGERLGSCKPGITGWAQVNCEYDTTVDSVRTKLLYDLAYNAHLFDLVSYLRIEILIILRTILVVATGKGAR